MTDPMEMDSDKKIGKVFNDPVHGHIELHPLLVRIIDTPQFQRLRSIKQLGGTYFVFPGASHSRFEHSIGVAHLAGELAQALKTRQGNLNITDADILCVQIAGLCHDLGHGPFSHLFDGMFMPEARPKIKEKHENVSIRMFEHLIKCNDLESEMETHELDLLKDLDFIKEMIYPKASVNDEPWPFKGRTEDKSFLYEIVSNKTNGIDVDKFDYFARDCHYLGIQSNFDHRRFLMFARVCEVNERKHICSREKEVHNLYDMFYTRMCLHRRACQHQVKQNVEIMINDAFLKAKDAMEFEGSGGRKLSLSEAIDDMEAFTQLTDHVFELILFSQSPKLDPAKEILKRIISRDLYEFVGEIEVDNPTEKMIDSLKKKLAQDIPQLGDKEIQKRPELKEVMDNFKQQLAEVLSNSEDLLNQQIQDFSKVTEKMNTLKQRLSQTQSKALLHLQMQECFKFMDKIDSLKQELSQAQSEALLNLQMQEYFEVVTVSRDYGMKDVDPIDNTYFYSKNSPNVAFKIPRHKVSKLLPKQFSEKFIRVYWKKTDKTNKVRLEAAKKHFDEWCKEIKH